jgi:hypothetical protein
MKNIFLVMVLHYDCGGVAETPEPETYFATEAEAKAFVKSKGDLWMYKRWIVPLKAGKS